MKKLPPQHDNLASLAQRALCAYYRAANANNTLVQISDALKYASDSRCRLVAEVYARHCAEVYTDAALRGVPADRSSLEHVEGLIRESLTPAERAHLLTLLRSIGLYADFPVDMAVFQRAVCPPSAPSSDGAAK